MAGSAGALWVQVKPSLEGFGADLRRQIEASVPPEIRVRIRPEDDPSTQGLQYAGKFADAFKARLAAALRNLPKVELDADATPAQRAVHEIRAELDALNGKRIGIDISAADARAELDRLTGKLDELARKSPDVQVRVDAAAARAELAAFAAEVDKLDGKNVKVNADTSGAQQGMSTLLTAGLALGPALIPIGASVAAALLSIGPAALAGAGAIAAVGLAFKGIGSAVSAYDAQQKQSAGSATSSANTQRQAAFSIASAQDGVTSAVRGLAAARASAADGAISAAEKVVSAERNAATSVQSALATQTSAEQTLTTAQRTQRQAQLDLVTARQTAAQQLRDLTFSTQDNALSQRGAQLSLESAQAQLSSLGSGQAGTLAGRQAQLAVDQARQQIVELQAQGGDLAGQKAAADKAGISGNAGVVAAQQRVTDSVQATGNAERALQAASAAVTKAQVDGAQSVADAKRAQAVQARTAADSIANATQGVTSAERGLAQARMSATSATSGASTATHAYQDALKKLSPAGQEFVKFYESSLKPRFDGLAKTAQTGLLPGLESGIKAATPAFDQLTTFIGNISGELGKLSDEAGHALTNPFWHSFFDFMDKTAGPSIDKVAHAVGNFITGAAGIMQALYQPVFVPIMNWVLKLSDKVSNFGTSAAAGTNSGFNKFIKYVQDNGPTVAKLLGDVVTIMDHWIQGMASQGAGTLDVVTHVMDAIKGLDPSVLAFLTDAFVAWKLAQTAIGGAKSAIDGIKSARQAFTDAKDMWNSIRGISWSDVTSNMRGIYDRLGGMRTLGGLVGVLGVVAAVAALELLSTKLDELNVKWQQGPGGKPTTQAEKTLGQSATNDAVTSLHDTVDPTTKLSNTTWEGFWNPKIDFKNSTVGKAVDQIVSQWNDTVKNFPDSPAGKFIQSTKSNWDGIGDQLKNSPIAHAIGGIGDQWNKDVADIPNSPAGKIWSSVSGWADKTKTDVSKSASDTWSNVSGWWDRTSTDVGKSASDAWSSVTGWSDRTTKDTGKSASDAWSGVTGWYGRTKDDVSKSASDAWSNVSGWWGRTTGDVGKSASDAWSNVSGWWNRTSGDVGKAASDAWSSATGWFGRMRDNVSGAASDLWRNVTGFVANLGRDLGAAWDGMVGYAQRAWAGIRAAAAIPVNFLVQTVYGGGIVPAWNAVADLVGLGHLPAPGPPLVFAQGGRVPSGVRGAIPGRDSVHALVMPGEFVVPTAMIPLLGGHDRLEAMRQHAVGVNGGSNGGVNPGIPAFGLGGLIGDIWGNISGGAVAAGQWLAGKAGAVGSFLTDAIGNAKNAVTGLFAGVGDQLGQFASSGIGQDAIHFPPHVADVITTKVANAVKSIVSSGTGVPFTGTPNLMGWISAAEALTGVGASWTSGLLTLIGRESGGNPNAINNWDSNARAGHPSQGLMQTIPSTFMGNHQPGTSFNILDPVANIAAGINYIKHTYGGIQNVQQANPNLPHKGYDSGGWLMPGRTAAANYTGTPEAVLNPTDSAAFRHVARAASQGRLGARGPGNTHNWTVYAQDMDVDRLATELERRTEFAHRTGGTP